MTQPDAGVVMGRIHIRDCGSRLALIRFRGPVFSDFNLKNWHAEREFVGGRFLTPLALRYDNQDVSRYTVDKTCIFFSFPYFLVAEPGLRKHYERDDPRHPARTLLQSHYRLNKTIDRDKDQCISLLKRGTVATSINVSDKGKQRRSRSAIKELVFVPQLWGIIDGLGM